MKFLIADDEQLVRLTIRTILNNYGIENQDIYQAGTGREMLAVLSEHRVDLAFVDIRMPEMTGLEAIRQSIALSGHTSFYILTGYDRFEKMENTGRRAEAAGAVQGGRGADHRCGIRFPFCPPDV